MLENQDRWKRWEDGIILRRLLRLLDYLHCLKVCAPVKSGRITVTLEESAVDWSHIATRFSNCKFSRCENLGYRMYTKCGFMMMMTRQGTGGDDDAGGCTWHWTRAASRRSFPAQRETEAATVVMFPSLIPSLLMRIWTRLPEAFIFWCDVSRF